MNYINIKYNLITSISYICMEILSISNDKINKKIDKLLFINFIEKNNQLKKIKFYMINISNLHKFKILNKSLTICAHILIMAIFEIYFFFDFAIDIENEKFIGKIDSYFRQLEPIRVTYTEKQLINHLMSNKYEDGFMSNLFLSYNESMKEQHYKLHQLLIRSYKMAVILGLVFVLILVLSFLNYKNIEWKTIISENIIMFIFLGIFEYYFFMNVIMKYEPVTNEEIQYKLTNGFIGYLNKSESY